MIELPEKKLSFLTGGPTSKADLVLTVFSTYHHEPLVKPIIVRDFQYTVRSFPVDDDEDEEDDDVLRLPAVWNTYTEYEAQMFPKGVVDFTVRFYNPSLPIPKKRRMLKISSVGMLPPEQNYISVDMFAPDTHGGLV